MSKLVGFVAYTANDPSAGNVKGGAAILIKSSLAYFPLTPIATDKVQLARFAWTTDDFKDILEEFQTKFIVAGDWNASHWLWGAGRSNQRGIA